MKQTIYNIRRGILNLFHWFKIIWSDRNFDPYYFYKLSHHKLNMMINSFEKKSYAVNAWYQIQYMKKARNILEKIISDEFILKAEYDKYLTKSDKLEDYFKLSEENTKALLELNKKEYLLRQKHIKTFFHILEKRLEHWWD